jgi:hypothetical protein
VCTSVNCNIQRAIGVSVAQIIIRCNVLIDFARRKRQRFIDWWRAPVTRRDRFLGATVGGMGCLWIGALVRIIFAPLPVSIFAVAQWAIAGTLIGIVLGIAFPKVVTCVRFPFAIFGAGT